MKLHLNSSSTFTYLLPLLVAAALMFATTATAQVHSQKIGDNPTTINANAALEVETTNKGFLPPRVALSSTTSASPLGAHVAGMLVYNTATTTTGTNDVSPGLYENSGLQWVKVGSTGSGDNLGNHTAIQNIRLNNQFLSGDGGNEGVFVDAAGEVAIGHTNPTQALDVLGSVKIVDGNQGAGKVLTSDANGVGTWQESGLSVVYGNIPATATSVTRTSLPTTDAARAFYTGCSIVIPPGTYEITFKAWLIATGNSLLPPTSQSGSTAISFSKSATVHNDYPSLGAANLKSILVADLYGRGSSASFNKYGGGSLIVTNPGTTPLTLYQWANMFPNYDGSVSPVSINFSSQNGTAGSIGPYTVLYAKRIM